MDFLNKLKITIFITILIVICSETVSSQQWGNMESNNFFELQQQFEEYWKDKTIEKGKGWKQFKRWEWYWKNRVDAKGDLPPSGMVQAEMEAYQRNHRGSKRSIQANWQSEGPDYTTGGYAGIGRMASVAFHPSNTNIIYAGAAGGGLWVSTNGGNYWQVTTDNLASMGVSSIAIHPTNPNILYIATGDGDAGDNYSVGVLKSTNGGLTFSTTGLNWATSNGRLIRRVLMDPDNPDILVAATSNGIYRTTNAGTNWTQVQTGNFYDLEFKPSLAANIWYAAAGSAVWKSSDDGVTWASMQTISGSNRISIAVTAANADYVYALASKSSDSGLLGVYRSTTSATSGSFTSMATTPNLLGWASNGSDAGGQGWYDLALTADPASANTIYVGGVNTWKSTNGGTSWTIKNHWSGAAGIQTVHADKHVFEWQGTVLWEGNDGGIYRSPDGGTKWEHKTNGMVISQLYKLGVGQTSPVVIGGLQDNGTKFKASNGNWSDEIGGDGMDCKVNKTNHNIMYGSLYYGDINRTTNGGTNWTNVSGNIPGQPQGGWVTPYELVPQNNTSIIAAYQAVVKSTNQGTSWTTLGTTAQVGNSTKAVLTIAPSDSNYVYTGLSNGGTFTLYKTINGGTSWTTHTVNINGGNEIVVHPTIPTTLWIVGQNFSNGNKIFKSVDAGATWTNVSGTLPNIPVSSVVYQNGTSNGLYIGTDGGVFYRDDTMTGWELFSEGLPNVEVTDLEIDYNNQMLYASTYGRGVWKTELNGSIPVCLYPVHLEVKNVSTYGAQASWDINTATYQGFEFAVTTSNTPPTSGTFTSALSTSFSSLNSNTNYYLHLRTVCSAGSYSQWITSGLFKTSPACSQSFTDSGGTGATYSSHEDITWTICPTTPCFNVKVTFTSINIEPSYDALYAFNGQDIMATQFSSANGITSAGFPAGGYYGTSVPGPFTSTHDSGCLTFRFMSDEADQRAGWNANVTCVFKNPLVSNTGDSGPGTLRQAIDCIASGDTITFSSAMTGQYIDLTSTSILINKNVNIYRTPSTKIKVRAINDQPIFQVQTGNYLYLRNTELYPDSGLSGRAVVNEGTLTLDDTLIYEQIPNLGSGNTIVNYGSVVVKGVSGILKL
jgi:hypothetical protein